MGSWEEQGRCQVGAWYSEDKGRHLARSGRRPRRVLCCGHKRQRCGRLWEQRPRKWAHCQRKRRGACLWRMALRRMSMWDVITVLRAAASTRRSM